MPFAEDSYTGDGSTREFNISFAYIEESHIKVALNEANITAFTVDTSTNPKKVVLTALSGSATSTQETTGAPKTDVAVLVYRDTPLNNPLVDYTDGSTLIADDLDTSNKQWLYLLQEQDDAQAATIQSTIAGQDAQNKKIINVADPTAAQHAATKNYVDTADATLLKRDGSNAMTGDLPMGDNKITGLATPTATTDASTKAYVDGLISTGSANVTAAQNAQAAAENARDSTLAAYDSFDDRYLGVKSSDPTTDNAGDALAAGMLYFHSGDGVMKLYTGSAWVAAYVSGAASSVSFTATGTIAATNVQAAIAELLAETAHKTATTGSLALPSGTAAQRDASPSAGFLRFNSDDGKAEVYSGTSWGSVGGGATGGGSDTVFMVNGNTVNTSYSIPTNNNAVSAGPITVASGAVVTIPSGSSWVIV